MKRRHFLQNASLGSTGLLIGSRFKKFNKPNSNGKIGVLKEIISFSDILSKEGRLILRFEFFNSNMYGRTDYDSRIKINKGQITKIRSYFFESIEDEWDEKKNSFDGISGNANSDIIVAWIDNADPDSRVEINGKRNNFVFTPNELIKKKELLFQDRDNRISVNYLLDREIGKIDPAEVNIRDIGDNFSFAVMADPQGGDAFLSGSSNTRMRIHNAWIEESVRLVNELPNDPLFTIMVGDIVDGQGPEGYFREMEKYFAKLKTPILYGIGNHESKYNASFEPGYSHESLRNFYEAQMRVNGMDKLLYSFDLGKWHFIVWPDPLRKRFWERHPHYFDWLEKDLEAHKHMPVMVFHHVPAHPVGIDPLTEYAESPYVKRTFTDILSAYGNVKYVLSGHVHIPLRASIKTAVEYNGMKFINLPAAGYRPRAFGEQDLYGGPSQGIAVINIKGEEASIDFKNVMNDVYNYPEKFRTFSPEEYPLWYSFRWELPKNKKLLNGDFHNGLDHWLKRYLYTEDQNPSNIQEIRKKPGNSAANALYLYSGKRDFDTAGQDRLPQTLNRQAQVIQVPPGSHAFISMEYMPEKNNFDPENRSSFFIWIEGYEKSTKRLNITYSPGYHFFSIERNYSQHRQVHPMRMELPARPGNWHKLFINPWKDFAETTDMKNIFLENIDRLIINLGVWTINDGYKQQTGVYFTGIECNFLPPDRAKNSNADGIKLQKKDNAYMVWGGVDHIAGEHIAWRSDMNFYGKADE